RRPRLAKDPPGVGSRGTHPLPRCRYRRPVCPRDGAAGGDDHRLHRRPRPHPARARARVEGAVTTATKPVPRTAPGPTIWPNRIRVLRVPGRITVRVDMRSLLATLALTALTLALSVCSLGVGSVEGADLPLDRVIGAFTGAESEVVRRIVVEGRLPRVLVAVLGGAALALSGAIFQTLTRNPLGSPDIIGFTSGANTGA